MKHAGLLTARRKLPRAPLLAAKVRIDHGPSFSVRIVYRAGLDEQERRIKDKDEEEDDDE
jgi:hypothetical protein